MKASTRWRFFALRMTTLSIVTMLTLSACIFSFTRSTELTRSDMPLAGLNTQVAYSLIGTPDGANEVNKISLGGMGTSSPMTQISTAFSKTSDTLRQQISQIYPENKPTNALAMTQVKVGFGLSGWLEVSASTHDMSDAKGGRACGAKVRMNFRPNAAQFLSGDKGKAWDAIWYYTVPCTSKDDPSSFPVLDAKFYALVINEQWVARLTGNALAFNRGRSVTIVGGRPAVVQPGWWQKNATSDGNNVLAVADMIKDMVRDLDTSSTPWKAFKAGGSYSASSLIYSAGDADVFWSVDKQFLNREVDYVVNYRPSPTASWKSVVIHPIYNFEWNDWRQNWKAFKDHTDGNLDNEVNEYGIPKDPNSAVVKEIEKEGWMNSGNPSLEQIQILDGDTGRILYAMTVRGYVGAKNSMIMFGNVPGSKSQMLASYGNNTPFNQLKDSGQGCPIKHDNDGNKLADDKQVSDSDCAELLREGPMWQMLTENPSKFGFDLVAQMNISNDGKWMSRCTGSGDSMHCTLVPQENNLNASYMFTKLDMDKPWTIMQLLGEVGVRTLGLSYASEPYAGTGLLYAMGQAVVLKQYTGGITDPERVFTLDARAMQLPIALGRADAYLRQR